MSYAGAVPPRQFLVSGQWITGVAAAASWQTVSGQSGRVTLQPTYLERPQTIASVACRINNAVAGATLALGVYDSDTAGLPRTLLGSATIDPTVTAGYKTGALSVFLPAGLLWFACLPVDATNALGVYANNASLVPWPMYGFIAADQSLRNDVSAIYHRVSTATVTTLPSSLVSATALGTSINSWRVVAAVA